MERKKVYARLIAGLVFVFFLLAGLQSLFSKVVITLDKSTPFTFYLKNKERKLEEVSFVLVRGKKNTFAEGKLLTKQVLCAYPKTLKKEGMSFYCCDGVCRYLHTAMKKTPKGTKLIPFNPCEGDPYTSKCEVKIPEGKYYLGTNVPDGYDSRYMGFFDEKDVLAVLTPLF